MRLKQCGCPRSVECDCVGSATEIASGLQFGRRKGLGPLDDEPIANDWDERDRHPTNPIRSSCNDRPPRPLPRVWLASH